MTDGKFGYEQLQGKAKISLSPGMEWVWEDMLGRASAKPKGRPERTESLRRMKHLDFGATSWVVLANPGGRSWNTSWRAGPAVCEHHVDC